MSERGDVDFNFKNHIRYSPVKIVPEGGAHIDVTYDPNKWQRTAPVIDQSPAENDAHGSISLHIGHENPITVQNGEVSVPDGATVDCTIPGLQPIHVEVHRDGSKPMALDPNTDPNHYHHIDGETPYTAQEFPNPLEPKMKIWEDKEPMYLNTKQVDQILGFSVKTIVEKGFIHPRYEKPNTSAQFTATDVLRALLVNTVKKEQHLVFWSQVSASSINPFTEQKLSHLREKTEWDEVVKRSRTYGVDLEQLVTTLLQNMSHK